MRRTTDDLVYLLDKQPKLLSPLGKNSSRSALLDIATMLHRDNTPKITPTPHIQDNTPSSTSEGGDTKEPHAVPLKNTGILSTEGDSIKEVTPNMEVTHDRIKRHITPVSLHDTHIHPSLYTPTTNYSSHIPTNTGPFTKFKTVKTKMKNSRT